MKLKFNIVFISVFILLTRFSVSSQEIKQLNLQSDTIELKELNLYKKKEINSIISKVLGNIKKNYPRDESHNFNINQLSTKNKDTIIHFNGSLNFIITNYDNSNLYYNNTYASLCKSDIRKINRQTFIEWFPSDVGKKNIDRKRGCASNELPFFITGAMNMVAIENYDFIRNCNKYHYSFEKINNDFFKLSFYPKDETINNNHPFEGYVVINKLDFAVLEVKYKNIVTYKLSVSDWYNEVSKIEVLIKFRKSEITNRYVLDSFDANTNFKNLIKNQVEQSDFFSKTIIKANENFSESCKNEKINLTDLGLIFKSETLDYLYSKKVFVKK